MTKERFLNTFSYISLLGSFAFLAVIGFWVLYPYKPLVINKEPMEVLTPKVKAGDNLVYKVEYCKYMSLNTSISKSLVDGIIFQLGSTIGNMSIGCGTNTIYVNMPKELPVGEYKLKEIWEYQVNPLRKISVTAQTEKFEVY